LGTRKATERTFKKKGGLQKREEAPNHVGAETNYFCGSKKCMKEVYLVESSQTKAKKKKKKKKGTSREQPLDRRQRLVRS